MMIQKSLLLQLSMLVICVVGSCLGDDVDLVQCSTNADCTGNLTTMTMRQCCVENDDGLSFTVNSTCHTCIVFGWFQETFSGVEQGPAHTFQAGYRKGRETAARNLVFNVTNIPGTAREGSNLDYTLGDPSVRALYERPIPDEVVATFRIDSVALEPDETFALELVPRNGFTLPSGLGVFFISVINVTIIDHDTLNIFFTEDDYRAAESSHSVPVRVAKDHRIATAVTVTVNPLTVMQAEEWEESIMTQMPDDNPFSPNRADFGDFDNTTVQVTFFPDEENPINEHLVPITIVDDDIDEAMEQIFVVTLKHKESIREESISLETRNSSLCRIIDNDDIAIGFERPSYTFSEPEFSETFSEGPVFLVKQDNRKSEQTFSIVIQVSSSTPGSSIRPATLSERLPNGTELLNDYVLSIAGVTIITVSFQPTQQRIPFIFTLFPDNLPESTEAFQASIAPRENSPSFNIPTAEAFIIIEDNDDIVIGFEEISYAIGEGINAGTLQVCVRVFNPVDQQTLPASILLTIQSQPNTATRDDFIEINAELLNVALEFDDSRRRNCFEVEIVDDNLVENMEDFDLELRFIGQVDQSGVVLRPNTATVTIIDDDAIIGFIDAPYTVSEGDGSALLQVGLIEGSIQGEVVIALSTNDSTAIAGSDYEVVMNQILIFTSTTTLINVPITIKDDSITEPTETFTSLLSLQSQLSNVTIQPAMAMVTILDDDPELNAVIGFLGSPYSTNESAGLLTVQVGVISGSLQTDVILNLSTIDITAIAGSDYEALVSVPLTFSPSSTLVEVKVTIIEDNVLESDESFNLTLSHSLAVTRGVQINPASAEASIIDDDTVSPSEEPATRTVVVIVSVLICILVVICVIIVVVVIIVCLCCKRKRGFFAVKLQQIHTDEDEESQQRQTPYTAAAGIGQAHEVTNQTGLLLAVSVDNLSQDSL